MKTNLGYKGTVTVKIKGKTVSRKHNTGTEYLFHALHSVLAQTITANSQKELTDHLPAYMMLVETETGQITEFSYQDFKTKTECLLLNEMPISKREVTSNSVKFTCLLTATNVRKQLSSGESASVILLDGAKRYILAHTSVEWDSLASVFDNTYAQAAIEWDMAFSNNKGTEGN